MSFTCDDLRLGGTLSDSGITGGVSINGTAYSVADWSGILGHSGYRATPISVGGRPGAAVVGEKLGRARFPTLRLNFGRLAPNGTLVAPSAEEQLQDNTDLFLSMLADPTGQYLELDMPDNTSRYLYVYAIDPSQISQPQRNRSIAAPLIGDWPYWRDSVATTDTISGADTVVVGGTEDVYDIELTFAGDGTFTHSTLGWELTVSGSGGAVVVNTGTRTVTESGTPAPNLLRRTARNWGWFTPGNNSVTSTVSVGLKWRSQFA